ncbi:MAG: gamma carbonic anhydrase family protein [Actinomycetota bacterium]|nr:gamma carbonic anhydrase family protein [Actinomycetota bacterium]
MIVTTGGATPAQHSTSWTAPDAVLVGAVELGDSATVWYTAVVRADSDRITIGARSNVQDGCVLHTDPGLHLRIGSGVTIGHRAVLHGCRIEDDVLVGMGAIVLNGAVIGSGSIIGAGALITEGAVIPPRSLVLGAPGKVRRSTTDDELAMIRINAEHYVTLAQVHAGS